MTFEKLYTSCEILVKYCILTILSYIQNECTVWNSAAERLVNVLELSWKRPCGEEGNLQTGLESLNREFNSLVHWGLWLFCAGVHEGHGVKVKKHMCLIMYLQKHMHAQQTFRIKKVKNKLVEHQVDLNSCTCLKWSSWLNKVISKSLLGCIYCLVSRWILRSLSIWLYCRLQTDWLMSTAWM